MQPVLLVLLQVIFQKLTLSGPLRLQYRLWILWSANNS